MQQLYLVEVFLDKIAMFSVGDKEGEGKKTKVRIKFGEDSEFILRQGRQVKAVTPDNDETDENGQKKWCRYYRCGNSILFASYPSSMTAILNRYPLEIDIWTDVENEQPELIGFGRMQWHTEYFVWLKETTNTCIPHTPFTIKEVVAIMQECCCFQIGEAYLIIRIVALGDSIITDFQQIMAQPEKFVFQTDKYKNVFQCVRIEGDNKEYNSDEHPYEVLRRNPNKVKVYERKIMVCTDMDACKFGKKGLDDEACKQEKPDSQKIRVIDRIKMKDIKGPCGNPSCTVAHKVKNYIRNMEEYKRNYNYPYKTGPRRICGDCVCGPDRFRVEPLTDSEMKLPLTKKACAKCMGKAQVGESCQDKIDKHYGTGCTPSGSIHKIHYLTDITRFKNPLFYNTYVVNNLTAKYFNAMLAKEKAKFLKKNPTARKVNKNCNGCNLDFFRHLNKEHKANVEKPIPNLSSALDTKSSVNSLLVEFNGGFLMPRNQADIPCTNTKNSASPTRSDFDQLISVFDRNDDYDSRLIGQSAVSGGCGCSKQTPTNPVAYHVSKPESMLTSNRCCCSKQNHFHSNRTGFEKPVNVIPSGGCGCSKRKPVKEETICLRCRKNQITDEAISPSPITPRTSENQVTLFKSPSKSSPEIRFFQVNYRRPDLVSPMVYNAAESSKKSPVDDNSNHPCLTPPEDKDCKCNPPIPSSACDTLDCNCITETLEIATRRAHKPYCPKYIHKKYCPVNMKAEEDQSDEEGGKEEEEVLPYGLPPIQLGPCPVIGRPCIVPDGFARMYKNAADVVPQPPSYSDAGKICCTKEFERIKKAINEYMKEQKRRDMRCINKYNIDTEKRCCDKEQALLALVGKTCCGSHKLEILERYKEKK